ncbi:MAG: hypothetical protein ACTHMM_26940 [Agriterribacter sp.]
MKNKFSSNIIVSAIIVAVMITLFIIFKMTFGYIDEFLPIPDASSGDSEFNDAEKFIKHGYPEIKSLGIQFLTLVTAILVFSLTFSEKIVNYSHANAPIRAILIISWTLLILAIIADGIGLAFNAFALPTALTDQYDNETGKSASISFYEPAFTALKAILMSGALFIGGLISLVIAGVASLNRESKAGNASK